VNRPLLLWDGDCAFCARCAAWAQLRLGRGVEIVPWQSVDLDRLAPPSVGLTPAVCTTAVQWLDRDAGGAVRRRSGARAVGALLVHRGGAWAVPGALALVPPTSWLAEELYRVVARNRHRLPGGTAACAIPPPSVV
jgi:predicted DCC family thiol-disulfide oxidoreductase YuxK